MNVVTDPEVKKRLESKMLAMLEEPVPTYKMVETSLYGGRDNPITIDDGEEDDEDDVPPSVKDEPDITRDEDDGDETDTRDDTEDIEDPRAKQVTQHPTV